MPNSCTDSLRSTIPRTTGSPVPSWFKTVAIAVLLAAGSASMAATAPETYEQYRQPGLNKPAISQSDILPLVDHLRESALVSVKEIGRSYEDRPIYRLQIGSGPVRVMMWSQMHGDEPTATPAIFDLVNFITAPEQAQWRAGWMDKVALVLVPMLNPDGAERNIRHNAQSFDINRDARALQSPEGRTLMALAREFEPHFAFNLHDQDRHYGVGDTGRMATISVLAPAYNRARDINDSRARAMQLIGVMTKSIEPFVGGHIARYDDTYAYRAFGDTFSGMGISTILVESGAHPGDPNRQVARRMNFEMLVTAIDSIAAGSYRDVSPARYDAIPLNEDDAIVDIKIARLTTVEGDSEYVTDLAINHRGDRARVVDAGDLSNLAGAQTLDASRWLYQPPRPFQLDANSILTLDDSRYRELLREGYGYFVGDPALLRVETDLPVAINPRNPQRQRPLRHRDATFLLRDDAGMRVAVINGQLVELQAPPEAVAGQAR
ncbi:M14 family metallopeptidase [Microbulbifer sediminum]|uniref:M14 family metallopeptidase n=1 Tax=Microbulbifer sediminum TaxID=2904250 RepID=UPI001F27D855|nr:M14 metallopeptidase family protein [Microbulbifer sediminum]